MDNDFDFKINQHISKHGGPIASKMVVFITYYGTKVILCQNENKLRGLLLKIGSGDDFEFKNHKYSSFEASFEVTLDNEILYISQDQDKYAIEVTIPLTTDRRNKICDEIEKFSQTEMGSGWNIYTKHGSVSGPSLSE